MAALGPHVLVVNCGSSSVKLALVDPTTGARAVTALAEQVGTADVSVTLTRGEQVHHEEPLDGSHRGVLVHLLARLTPDERRAVVGVGHRVVHGGDVFRESVVVDDGVVAALRGLTDLAPLHTPANLAGIAAARHELPAVAQVAVFDTAFHQTMPPVAYRYAVPGDWYQELGVRRYGFHGTSHRYVSARAAELLDRPSSTLRLVTLHLGNGASAAAISEGRSVDTTMGMTPLEGLVMGTRSGDLDPAVHGYVADRLGLTLPEVLDALNSRSGLLGLSGISNDMRTLVTAAQEGNPDAALAVEVFCYRVAKAVGAMAVVLGRVDGVVFTGGIGEHSAPVRAQVLAQLGVIGFTLDPVANADDGRTTGGRISTPGGPVALVVPTDEERLIAQDTVGLVG